MNRCLLDKDRMGSREKEAIPTEETAYANKRANDRR